MKPMAFQALLVQVHAVRPEQVLAGPRGLTVYDLPVPATVLD
jgi:hypothetical protein